MNTGRIIKRLERIVQLPDSKGWLNIDSGKTHKSAAHAKAAVERRDKALSEHHKAIITTIEWSPINPLGTMVVKALDA